MCDAWAGGNEANSREVIDIPVKIPVRVVGWVAALEQTYRVARDLVVRKVCPTGRH